MPSIHTANRKASTSDEVQLMTRKRRDHSAPMSDKYQFHKAKVGFETFVKGGCYCKVYAAWYHFKSCDCPKSFCKGWKMRFERAEGGVLYWREK